MLTLYDADRCPYCARVRIVLAEKGLEHETVVVDLDDRPAWIYEKNPLGRVPVLEEDAFVLPESAVIMEYLEERYPEPPLWPADPAERAIGLLLVERFDQQQAGEQAFILPHSLLDRRHRGPGNISGADLHRGDAVERGARLACTGARLLGHGPRTFRVRAGTGQRARQRGHRQTDQPSD